MFPPLTCPRCGNPGEGYAGCRPCHKEGVPVNLEPSLADLGGVELSRYQGGPWGMPSAMPVPEHGSMLEGNTPCLKLVDKDDRVLWIKDETRNPSGTHKDRAMSVGVAAAVAAGASTVVAASSGNAGASAAMYAARVGLRCVVLTTTRVPQVVAAQIKGLGATLLAYPDQRTRNQMMGRAVNELGWYPLTNFAIPCSGDNPYANEGYKSIAYELARDLGSDVDDIVVPTSGADVLAGIERGYRELHAATLVDRVPRLIAAETATGAPFTAALRLPDRAQQERVIVEDHPSPAFSIGATVPTWQGLHALWRTNGEAIAVDVDAYMAEYQRLPASTGIFLEASSVVAVVAARQVLRNARRVVVLGTGSGLKGLSGHELEDVPASPPGLDALVSAA